MATAEEARRELARRELERRRQSEPVDTLPPGPITGGPFNDPRGAALTVGSGAVALPVSGLAGLAGLVGGLAPGGESPSDKAARFQRATQDAITINPPNQASVNALDGLGSVTRALSAPFAASLVHGMSQQDETRAATEFAREFGLTPDEKSARLNDILDRGVSKSIGELAQDVGAPPSVATAFETVPAAISSTLGFKGVRPRLPQPKPLPPKTSELFQAGSEQFARARQLGGGINVDSSDAFAASIAGLKDNKGLGVRFNEKLYPQAAGLREEILDSLNRGVDFDELIELRQMASDVAGNPVKGEAFRGQLLKQRLDEYVNGLTANDMVSPDAAGAVRALNDARENWHKASKAATIEEAIEIAGINANTFSGAGFENALRTQFKILSRRIAKGQEPGFTKAEIEMIRKVANGGPVDNAFRWLGKSAPTGIVSAGIGFGGGTALGGPLVGAGVVGAGLLGRGLATRATIGNSKRALEMVQLGNTIPK